MTCGERLLAAAKALRSVTGAAVRVVENRLEVERDLVPNPRKGDRLPARILGSAGLSVTVHCDHRTAAERGDAAIPPPAASWKETSLELGGDASGWWVIEEPGPTYFEIYAAARTAEGRAEVDRILRTLRESIRGG